MSELFGEYAAHGWKLTPIEPGLKYNTNPEWQRLENAVVHPLAAGRLKAAGLMHAYSGTCAIDIDHYETARAWLWERGVDLDALLNAPDAVRVKSPALGRGKLLYALPDPLPTKKLAEYESEKGRRMALELRCGTRDGGTVQDVLPPSPHPDEDGGYIDGYYEWAGGGDWRSLPPLPEPLHRLWLSLTAEVGPAVTETTIGQQRVAELLERLDPDMVRDDWYRVGMAVHHEFSGAEAGFALWHAWSARGEKYAGERDCRRVWESFESGGGITGQSLEQMADTSVDVNEFPVVETPEAAEKQQALELWTARDLLTPHDAPPYLVHGLLEHGAEASLIGPSKSYKSLWAIELGVRVASGTPFFERETAQGLVMYLCGEGAGGLAPRLQALRYARELDFADAPFVVLPRPVALPTGNGVQLVKNLIAQAEHEYEQPLKLLVIDTYGRYAAGEENVAEDLYKFFRAASACRGDAALLVVHHTGHGDASRGRGTSAWDQAVDTEFISSIREETQTRVVENTKQKDGEPASPMYFTLARYPTDSTRDGEPISSVVLEPTVQETAPVKLSPSEQVVYDKIKELGGGPMETVYEEITKGMPRPDGKDNRRDSVRRAMTGLTAKKLIDVRDEHVYLTGDVTQDFSDLLGGME